MKTKTKKEMNLHELIQWAWENDVKGKTFKSNRGKKVKFYSIGGFNVMEPIWGHDIFNVEVEEEITEDTILPSLLVVHKDEDYIGATHWKYRSIRSLKEKLVSSDIKPMAFYVLHHDASMTLIYKSGGMVE
ncbi:hypothetical protein [Staphylococcus pseudintermedius]|uniref:hypothetical protein n=1 Tax=Staphylococcus pseudintermedius TaxID=283734 RepID=UPI003F654EE0